MHNVVCEQVKSLKIMHERKKDENESLMTTLRDIQSESFDKQKFGKLYYVVMLYRNYSDKLSMKIFRYSILYLGLIFTAFLIDHYFKFIFV